MTCFLILKSVLWFAPAFVCFMVWRNLWRHMFDYMTTHSIVLLSHGPWQQLRILLSHIFAYSRMSKNWSQTSWTLSDWLLSLSLVHVGFLQGISLLVVELPLLFNAIHCLHTLQFIYSFTLWLKKQSNCKHARISCEEASFQLLWVNTKKWWHSSSVTRFSLIDLFTEQKWFSNIVFKKSNWPINS